MTSISSHIQLSFGEELAIDVSLSSMSRALSEAEATKKKLTKAAFYEPYQSIFNTAWFELLVENLPP